MKAHNASPNTQHIETNCNTFQQHHKAVLTGKPLFPETKSHHYVELLEIITDHL